MKDALLDIMTTHFGPRATEPLPREVRRTAACQLLGKDLDQDTIEPLRIVDGHNLDEETAPAYYASLLLSEPPKTVAEALAQIARLGRDLEQLRKQVQAQTERINGLAAREAL